jgi:hypothetical protein
MTDVATVASDLTAEQARESVEQTKRGLEAAANEIVRQINGRAWISLGYQSWDEMREAEYSGAAVIVPRADRPQLSARLAAEGLSQKQISETLGVSQATVSGDLRDVINSDNAESEGPATRPDALGREQPRAKPRLPEPTDHPEPSSGEGRSAGLPPAVGAAGESRDGAENTAEAADELPADRLAELDDELDAEMEGTVTRFRKNFSAVLARSDDIWQFEPERVAEVYAVEFDHAIRPFLQEMNRWCEQVAAAHRRQSSGLRVVTGGMR